MRKRIIAISILFLSILLNAQAVELTLEQELINDTLFLKGYIRSDTAFELGSSNFIIHFEEEIYK